MPLLKLEDYYPDYRDVPSDINDIKHLDVYAEGDDKVGSVHDVLVDADSGQFRYYVVDTGFWIFGKKVLLPVGRARIDHGNNRIYVSGLTKEQVEHLPEFAKLETVDYDYEEQVRNVYRPTADNAETTTTGTTTAATMATGAMTGMDAGTTTGTAATANLDAPYDRDTYAYDRDPALYNLSQQDQQSLKLYEERLIANKQRQKTGEVTIGKHVETETARVAVPIEKERVVIERTAPTGQTVVDPSQVAFGEGEVARVEVYEETPEIRKEAVLREEVKVKKVTEQETVNAEETLRREELDVDTQGRPTIDGDR